MLCFLLASAYIRVQVPDCRYLREDQIRELPRWLDTMKEFLNNHGIAADQDLKEYIGKYADQDSADEWQSLDMYSKGMFEEHKKVILETYPELKDRLSGSLKMLDKLF